MREWIEENRGFWLLLACTLIPIFFQLDQTLGAVGLRAIYGDAALIVGTALISLGLYLGLIANSTSHFVFKAIGLLVIAVLLFLVIESISNADNGGIGLAFIAAVLTIPFTLIVVLPPIVYVLAAIIVLGLRLTRRVKRLGLVIVGVAVLVGLGLCNSGTFTLMYGRGQYKMLQVGDYLYQLEKTAGGFEISSRLKLYQCTTQGLWCSLVHEIENWYEDRVRLAPTADSTGVQIRLGSEVIYTYYAAFVR
jgi:hypothetical protein